MKAKKKKRLNVSYLLFIIFFLCLFLLYIRFAFLSLATNIDGINIKSFAANRNTVKKTIRAKRGNIYDVEGNVLALNVSSYTLVASLEKSKVYNGENYVKDIEGTAHTLAEVLNADEEYILNQLKKDAYQVELGNYGSGLTELKKDEILALGLPGISFTESQKRYYPNGDFASYIIGYAKTKEVEEYDDNDEKKVQNEIVGELGIEAYYNNKLKGIDGYTEYQQSRYGYKIAGTSEIRVEAENGSDIYLTLDSNIQRFVESGIKKLEENFHPEWTLFAVMDAKTGDILGFSSTPSFDPNIKNIKNYENPLVTFTYEPGSTMKTFTYMCALENNSYNGDLTYQSGSYTIGEYTINDWNNGWGWGTITYDKGYEYSSNVGVVNLLMNHLTKQQLKDCLRKYGFGSKTGIELAGESNGKIDFRYDIEYATAGYGQGITTTVVQQLQALTLISNNGKMLKPHIISKIVNGTTGKVEYERKVEASEQIVKTSTVNKMKELMYNVIHGTDEGNTGYIYRIDGFDIIGKTGTGQIYDPTYGYLYGDNLYIYSFAGMYPKDDPEIIIYAAMKKPTWGNSRGLYTTTKEIIQSISKYKSMFTDITEKKGETYEVKSYLSKDKDKVVEELRNSGIVPIVIGSGTKITKQSVKKGTKLAVGDKIILLTSATDYKIPNLTGWSKIDAISLFKLLNVKYEINGTGYVTTQSCPYDTPVTSGLVVTLQLEDRLALKPEEEPVEEESEDEDEEVYE